MLRAVVVMLWCVVCCMECERWSDISIDAVLTREVCCCCYCLMWCYCYYYYCFCYVVWCLRVFVVVVVVVLCVSRERI